jgi:hypothetical protein
MSCGYKSLLPGFNYLHDEKENVVLRHAFLVPVVFTMMLMCAGTCPVKKGLISVCHCVNMFVTTNGLMKSTVILRSPRYCAQKDSLCGVVTV